MVKKIIWSKRAKRDWLEILEYWVQRNKSKNFSIKLNQHIEKDLILILKFPLKGKKTDISNIRVINIKDYLMYYEIKGETLLILTIRDSRRNPNELKI